MIVPPGMSVRLRRLMVVALLLAAVPAGLGRPRLAGAGGTGGLVYGFGTNLNGEIGNGSPATSFSLPVAASLPAGVSATSIAGGSSHSLAVGSDGHVYAWGYNLFGELGNGSTTNSSTPVVVSMPSGVIPTLVAAGSGFSVALCSNGAVYAWGDNSAGELGNGTTNSSDVPVAVHLPTGVTATAIAAGAFHALAIGSNGKTYAWGLNASGELGNGTNTNSNVPAAVSLPAGVTVTHVAGGYYHSLAIDSHGNLYSWGSNSSGQLGNGTMTDSNKPVMVPLPDGASAAAIAGGQTHSMALGSNGRVYAWGDNGHGELGNGSTTNSSVPVAVSLPAGVSATAVSAEYFDGLALGSDGNLYAWGYNVSGQLGNGTTTDSDTPVEVDLPAGAAPAALGAGAFFTLVLLTPNQGAYAAGSNSQGQLGNGTTADSSAFMAVRLPAGVTPTALAVGSDFSLALGSDNTVYAWGDNAAGQLGDGTTTSHTTPVAVKLPAGVTITAIAAGDAHSLAVGSDNKVYAWGLNSLGQLGNGTTTNSSLPVVVTLPPGFTPAGIAAGGEHSVALGLYGRVYAWGANSYGQLGNGTTTDSSTPVLVNLPGGFIATAIAAGDSHSLALGSTGVMGPSGTRFAHGVVYGWGFDEDGELGNGMTTDTSTPVAAQLPAGVVISAIAAGAFHSLALDSSGKAYAWGDNFYGELGNGTTTTSSTPVLVSLPSGTGATAIAGSGFDSLLLDAGGTVYLWGNNDHGELGNRNTTNSTLPQALPIVSGLMGRVLGAGPTGFNTLIAIGRPGATAVVVNRFVGQRHGSMVLLRWRISDPRSAAGFRILAGSRLITPGVLPVHAGIRAYHYRTAVQAKRYVLQVLLRHGSVVTANTRG